MRKRWKLLVGVAAVVATTFYACGEKMMWTKVSSNFMQDSKPYGAGDFRVRGDYVITMKLADPPTSSKPMTKAQLEDPDFVPEPTEAWMRNIGEIMNRRAVSFYSGRLNGPVTKFFEERAKEMAWWSSNDLNTIYLCAGWMDRTTPPQLGYDPQFHKLFKSTDGGKNWQRLEWPEANNISQLRFTDPQHGYAIGWGPHIWRTEDGGLSWKEINVPFMSRSASDERKQFDWVDLSADGILRVVFFADFPGIGNASLVYALRSGEPEPTLEFAIPAQTVVDLIAIERNVYVLTQQGLPTDYNKPGDDVRANSRASAVVLWDGNVQHTIKVFDKKVSAGALYRTPSNALIVDGTQGDGFFPNDVVFITRDQGQTWKEEDEGSGAQGVYYDQETGVRWRVSGYSLYNRTIR